MNKELVIFGYSGHAYVVIEIAEGCGIGANSVVKPAVKIGANVTGGAEFVILNNVPYGVTVFGNPAKI
jgi:acetyltransferase-like isoleucine patch superfamily enzyme